MEANLFRLQARSLVSKKAFSLFLILSDSSAPERERRPPAGQKGLHTGRSSLQRPGKRNPVWLPLPVAEHPQRLPPHHTPALGSCFPAAEAASPQTAERERNGCHLSPVKNSATTSPDQQSQTQKGNYRTNLFRVSWCLWNKCSDFWLSSFS